MGGPGRGGDGGDIVRRHVYEDLVVFVWNVLSSVCFSCDGGLKSLDTTPTPSDET